MVSRRDFLKVMASLSAGVMFSPGNLEDTLLYDSKLYRGQNFASWEVALGDALYARAGEPPVSVGDIRTIHSRHYSELQANINRRVIMAHNITFKRIIDSNARSFVHTCAYKFKLPYVPAPDVNLDTNAQTLEGGIFVWDGADTRLDYGIAFQWSLNPWNEFGTIRTWADGGVWENKGFLQPDTQWHIIRMVIDFPKEKALLIIDETRCSTYITKTPKPSDWGAEVAARLQAEIVSIDPEPAGMKAMHKAQFKNWIWWWEKPRKKR